MDASKSIAGTVKAKTCPICKAAAEVSKDTGGRIDQLVVECKNCGLYKVDGPYAIYLSQEDIKEPRHVLAGALRNASELGQVITLDGNNVQRLIDEAPVPRTLFEAMDRMLLYLAAEAPNFVYPVNLEHEHFWPILFATNAEESEYYLLKMKDAGLIQWESGQSLSLSLAGWERVEELRATGAKSDQGFVAMWFDPSTDDAWEHGFKPALTENGYDAVRVDLVHHNQKICDRIIAEIRSSGLVVADFTGNRSGVYYEAGYAQGLGIPVIWTCREDDIDELHFDTRQYNHIVWSDPSNLNSQLSDRIEATVSAPR